MKILLKKEVCRSHKQCTEPTKKVIKKKKKVDADAWTCNAIQMEPWSLIEIT